MKDEKRKLPIFVIALFLIAILLVNVSILFTQSIRLDESQSIWAATKPIAGILEYTAEDVHVPLYSLLLHYWLQVIGTNIQAVRLLSLTFFLFTLPILYKLTKESGNREIAIISVALFATSPFIIWYSSEVRMYTLFILITAINNLFFLRFVKSRGKSSKFGLWLSLIAGYYTHYFFLLQVATQSIFIFVEWLRNYTKDRDTISLSKSLRKESRVWVQYIGLVVASIVLFLPWVMYFLIKGAGSSTQPLIPKPTSYNIFQTFINFLFGFQSQGIQSILVSLWPLAVLVLFFAFTRKSSKQTNTVRYFALSSFLPILLVFIISYVKPIFLTRYLIFITPSLFYVIAWIIENFPKKIYAYVFSIFLAVISVFLMYQNISASTPVKENYEGVASYLSLNAKPQDIIAVTPPFTTYPIEFSYTGKAKITTIPQWDRYVNGPIPKFSEDNLKMQIEEYRKIYRNIYLVFSYDQGYENNIKVYMDQNYKRLEESIFSPGLTLRKYQLRYD